MRLTLLGCITVATLVGGCSPDHRKADIDACGQRAMQEISHLSGLTQEQIHDEIGSAVVDCMKDKGYRHDMASDKCLDDVDLTSACYVKRR